MSNKKEQTKLELFEELSNVNDKGISRWVDKEKEFKGKYERLYFDNGFPWGRGNSPIAKKYNIEKDRSISSGTKIDRIRLNGFNTSSDIDLSQTIRTDIKKDIEKQRCVVLGTKVSCDYPVETDHKDGRKNNPRIMNTKTQVLDDFQPLSKPANVAKRSFCKECKETNLRYDAKLLGYPVSFTQGDTNYTQELGCIGCFWYDPIAFRQSLELKNSSNN